MEPKKATTIRFELPAQFAEQFRKIARSEGLGMSSKLRQFVMTECRRADREAAEQAAAARRK